eukprot:1833226-Lingulodinium_polyedra.AAC.1
MGGPFSAAATTVDLEHDVSSLYCDTRVARRVGWLVPKVDMRHTVQGVLHVDDSIVFSKILCEDCLIAGVAKLFPADIGMSCEARGACIPFLHAQIVIIDEECAVPVVITPL